MLMLASCGVNKEYVAQQISESEARTNTKITTVESTAQNNAEQLQKLQTLANELSKKTDMAINEAKGFENYQIIWSGEINFDFDSFEIDNMAAEILNEAGEKMEAYPGSVLEIVGHTDRTGSKNYNYLLGEKRASSAQRYLAERFGISIYRMFIMSYGKDKPIAMPDEKYAASKNRRVTLTIWGNLTQ
jgi:peptidoglycan-associated lipoprotein